MKIYICSPLRGNIEANIKKSTNILQRSNITRSLANLSTHIFYTIFGRQCGKRA